MLLAGSGPGRHRRRVGRRLGGRATRPDRPPREPVQPARDAVAWACGPICCVRGRTGSPRSSSRDATTPASSSPRCPPGQHTRDVGGEADATMWLTPREALARYEPRRARDAPAHHHDADASWPISPPQPKSWRPRPTVTSLRCSRASSSTGEDVELLLPHEKGYDVVTDQRPPEPAVLRAGDGDARRCMLAPNPSPMTLEGTNTWMLRGSGDDGVRRLRRDRRRSAGRGAPRARSQRSGTIELILLTHGHPDHSGGSARLAELTGAPVLALDRSVRRAAASRRHRSSSAAFDARRDRHARALGRLAVVLPAR